LLLVSVNCLVLQGIVASNLCQSHVPTDGISFRWHCASGTRAAAVHLLPECLVLVYPPIAHELSLRRFSMHLYVISWPVTKKLRLEVLTCLAELKPKVGRLRTIVEPPVTVLVE
jgi:hypothetical protein